MPVAYSEFFEKDTTSLCEKEHEKNHEIVVQQAKDFSAANLQRYEISAKKFAQVSSYYQKGTDKNQLLVEKSRRIITRQEKLEHKIAERQEVVKSIEPVLKTFEDRNQTHREICELLGVQIEHIGDDVRRISYTKLVPNTTISFDLKLNDEQTDFLVYQTSPTDLLPKEIVLERLLKLDHRHHSLVFLLHELLLQKFSTES